MMTTYNEGVVRPYRDKLLFPAETKIRKFYSPISSKKTIILTKPI